MRNWIDIINEVIAADEEWGSDWEAIEQDALMRYMLGYGDQHETLEIWSSAPNFKSSCELYLVEEPDGEQITLSYLSLSATGKPNVLKVSGAITNPKYIRQGMATTLYQFVLNHGCDIVSDDSQTQGGKAIWRKLARDGYEIVDNQSNEKITDIDQYYATEQHGGLRAHHRGLMEFKMFQSRPYAGHSEQTIFKNPTLTELDQMVSMRDYRGITDGKSLFVWDAGGMIHYHGAFAIGAAMMWEGETLPDPSRIVPRYNPTRDLVYLYNPDRPNESVDEWRADTQAARDDLSVVAFQLSPHCVLAMPKSARAYLATIPVIQRLMRNAVELTD